MFYIIHEVETEMPKALIERVADAAAMRNFT